MNMDDGWVLLETNVDPVECVSLRTFLTRREDVDRFRQLRDQLHAELYPRGNYPAHTLLLVSGLALPGLLIEVEAVVAI